MTTKTELSAQSMDAIFYFHVKCALINSFRHLEPQQCPWPESHILRFAWAAGVPDWIKKSHLEGLVREGILLKYGKGENVSYYYDEESAASQLHWKNVEAVADAINIAEEKHLTLAA